MNLGAHVDVPLLVEHGAWLWKPALALAVLLSLIVWRRLLRAVGAMRARSSIFEHSSFASLLNVEVRRGRVVRGWARTVWQDRQMFSETSGDLEIEVNGDVLRIRGDVNVHHGATETAWWYAPPLSLSEHLRVSVVHCTDAWLREITVGDEVLVSGRIERLRVGSDEAISAGFDPVRISAVQPAATPRGYGPRTLLLVGILLLGWHTLFSAIGEAALKSERNEATAGDEFFPIRLQLAASLPGSRADALSAIEGRVRSLAGETEMATRLAATLALGTGDCRHDMFARTGHYEDALALARRCGRTEDVGHYLLILGRYREAASLLQEPSLDALRAAVGDAQWIRAAEILETSTDRTWALQGATCMAAVFRSYAGKSDTFADLKMTSDCQIYRFFTLPLEERVAYLKSDYGRAAIDSLEGRLTAADGGPLLAAFIDPWLAKPALAHHSNDADSRAVAYLHYGLYERAVAKGLLDEADRELELARSVLDAEEYADASAAVARRDPDTRKHRLQDSEIQCAVRSSVDLLRDSNEAAFIRALRGVTLPSKCVTAVVAPLLPRIHSRAALATAVRWSRDIHDLASDYRAFPAQAVWELGRFRDFSRAVGDHDDAAFMAAIVDRHIAVLEDPQRLVAFALLDTL